MGHNDPARRAAIAASIGEYEPSPHEITWSNIAANQASESRHDQEEYEYCTEARRLCANLAQLHETPHDWWSRQNQSSYFSRQTYKALCEIWEEKHLRSNPDTTST